MRRLMLLSIPLLLFGLMALAPSMAQTTSAGGMRTGTYAESPMTAALVEAGELPPVDERLPDEPIVVEPVDEIGTYGGTWMDAFPNTEWGITEAHGRTLETVILLGDDLATLIPNYIKSWEWNADATELTFNLHPGLKWSDGAPSTADDWMFWYHDYMLNTTLRPVPDDVFRVGDEYADLEKIDDYTIRWVFPEAYGYFVERLGTWPKRNLLLFFPKHYLQQFHPDYTPMADIEKVMSAEKFDTWADLFLAKNDALHNPQRPTMYAWKSMTEPSSQLWVFERNPYYFKVDTEGNQLPYIDAIHRVPVGDVEGVLLKILAGEVDLFRVPPLGGLRQLPVLHQNKEQGDYELHPYFLPPVNMGTIYFNMSHKDPVIRGLFRDQRFRSAMSVALNREEINQLVYKGLTYPSQPAPGPGAPYHGDDPIFKTDTEYDPDRANALLDELGLTDRDSDGFRMRPDGEKLLLVYHPRNGWPLEGIDMAELYKKYWADVGINIQVKPLTTAIMNPIRAAADYDMHGKAFIVGGKIQPPLNGYVFPTDQYWRCGEQWGMWISTGGEQGEEPPDWVKRMDEIRSQVIRETDKAKRDALFNEAIRLDVENCGIGVVQTGGAGHLENQYIARNRFGNLPAMVDGHFYSAPRWQFYFKQ